MVSAVMTEPGGDERAWERGWDGHELAQRRRFAKLSIDERLLWLEDMHRLARELDAARQREREAR
jgi:hypothetical protein